MGWEKRGTKRVYYRSVRTGKTIRKQYFGAGEAAKQAAAEDAEKRAKRQADQVELQRLQSQLERPENYMNKLEEELGILIDAVMYSAGFHNRKGSWRKKRDR